MIISALWLGHIKETKQKKTSWHNKQMHLKSSPSEMQDNSIYFATQVPLLGLI